MSRKSDNYAPLKSTWIPVDSTVESFFVSYAVRGPMVCPAQGLEAGIPVVGPIPGPLSEPSPLNTVWRAEFAKGPREIGQGL